MREIILDLIVDIRCAERDGQPEYAEQCRRQVRAFFKARHTARRDRYGWPLVEVA